MPSSELLLLLWWTRTRHRLPWRDHSGFLRNVDVKNFVPEIRDTRKRHIDLDYGELVKSSLSRCCLQRLWLLSSNLSKCALTSCHIPVPVPICLQPISSSERKAIFTTIEEIGFKTLWDGQNQCCNTGLFFWRGIGNVCPIVFGHYRALNCVRWHLVSENEQLSRWLTWTMILVLGRLNGRPDLLLVDCLPR